MTATTKKDHIMTHYYELRVVKQLSTIKTVDIFIMDMDKDI